MSDKCYVCGADMGRYWSERIEHITIESEQKCPNGCSGHHYITGSSEQWYVVDKIAYTRWSHYKGSEAYTKENIGDYAPDPIHISKEEFEAFEKSLPFYSEITHSGQ